MGFIRRSLFFLASIALILSLLAGNIFLTAGTSMNYDDVKARFYNLISKEIGDAGIENNFQILKSSCSNNNSVVLQKFSKYTINVSCDSISLGPEAVLISEVDSVARQIYYNPDACEFYDCINNLNPEIFSQKTKDFIMGKFYFFMLVSLFLMALLFVLSSNKLNFPITIGIALMVSSLPLLAISKVVSFFDPQIGSIVSLFFSETFTIFLFLFITGSVLVALGVGMRFWFEFRKILGKFSKKRNRKENKRE